MTHAAYKIFLDGSEWCATSENFTNLQESLVGFGGTPVEALEALMTSEETVADESS